MMKTFEGEGYLVHSSDSNREWKDHKYIQKIRLANGKYRYVYKPTKNTLWGIALGADTAQKIGTRRVDQANRDLDRAKLPEYQSQIEKEMDEFVEKHNKRMNNWQRGKWRE